MKRKPITAPGAQAEPEAVQPEPVDPAALPADAIASGRAGRMLRVSPATICRWVLEGRLPGWKVHRRMFVSEADVRAMVTVVEPTTGQRPEPVNETQAMKAATVATLREFGLA
ncbi:MAG: helix-turn-helix domain-containing protein [Gemmataceae bacterium]|nr:helix-turn-helix domain-containing protein [Gemmataceae bacterium]